MFFALAAMMSLSACKKDEVTPEPTPDPTPTPTPSLVVLSSALNTNNETVTLLAKSATVETGWSQLFVQVKDANGTAVENAMVMFMPMMDMGTMQHSAPVVQPTFNTAESAYEGVVVFTMPSTAGTWTIDVSVNGTPVTLDVNVADAPTKMVGSYTGTDANVYIVSLVRPVSLSVGLNDFQIAIHKKASMMSFPADDSFTVQFEPEMVSMGHSSPNNTDPVSIGDGLYQGVVNYSMSGDWRLHLRLMHATDTIVNDAYVDVLF